MFNSGILDVAIGLIFIYLLLSLIASAANEMIERWLKNRATDLERGIRELLEDPEQASSIVTDVYNHPLINSLFVGKYGDGNFNRKNLPSYIPARNFALAIWDLALSGKPAAAGAAAAGAAAPAAPGAGVGAGPAGPGPANPGAAGAGAADPGAADPGAAGAAPADPGAAGAGGAGEAGAGGAAAAGVGAGGAGAGAGGAGVPPPIDPAAAAAITEMAKLREALAKPNSAIPERVRTALLALITQAGNDVNKARESIEDWFNSAMDRVSGWYKRRSQLIVFFIGLFIAFAVNADSVLIAKRLASDKSLRESLAGAAEQYARVNASASPSPSPATGAKSPATGGSTTTPPATPPTTPATTPAATASASATPPGKPTPTPSRAIVRNCPPPDCTDVDSPECKLKRSLCDIESLGLPIGWEYENDLRRRWPGADFTGPGGWGDQLYWHLLGWLVTALAVSLGAPFWFDLLNKFIVVRSTVKPKEKSPEEPSKD